jgi:hypothetical protein
LGAKPTTKHLLNTFGRSGHILVVGLLFTSWASRGIGLFVFGVLQHSEPISSFGLLISAMQHSEPIWPFGLLNSVWAVAGLPWAVTELKIKELTEPGWPIRFCWPSSCVSRFTVDSSDLSLYNSVGVEPLPLTAPFPFFSPGSSLGFPLNTPYVAALPSFVRRLHLDPSTWV